MTSDIAGTTLGIVVLEAAEQPKNLVGDTLRRQAAAPGVTCPTVRPKLRRL